MCKLGGLAMLSCPEMSQGVQFMWKGHVKLPLSVPNVHVMWIGLAKIISVCQVAYEKCVGQAKLPLSVPRCVQDVDWPG